MGKYHITGLVAVFCGLFAWSQDFSGKRVINPEPSTVRMVRSADVDGDGDMDVAVAASSFISWYENLDGQGSFGPPVAVQEGMGQSFNIALGPVDSDARADLVVSFFDEGTLAWYRNTGNGFGPMQVIALGFLGARGVTLADLDGDGDSDIVFGISNFSGLYWFENGDGEGSFGPPQAIDASIPNARSQAVGDIDGDGDLDVLTNSSGGVSVSWYENLDGQGTFGGGTVVEQDGLYENYIYLFDIDGDGDPDILSEKIDAVIWRENLDGQGSFGPQRVIDELTANPSDAIAVDLDGDGDRDVLVTFSEGNRVAWYENLDGQGSFGPQRVIDADFQAPRTVCASDLDGDGDPDVVTAALEPGVGGDRELVWYENLSVLGVDGPSRDGLVLYPNPVRDLLQVESAWPVAHIAVYGVQGQKLWEGLPRENGVDLSQFGTGLYFVEVRTEMGSVVKRVVKD